MSGMRLTWTLTTLAVGLFGPMFAVRQLGRVDFWWWMCANLTVLLILVAWLDHGWIESVREDLSQGLSSKLVVAVGSAFILYGLFAFGDWFSRQVVSLAARQIQAVYAFGAEASVYRIALSMLLIIGPGEELFWRGFLQRRLCRHLGLKRGWLSASAVYALVHAGSGNLMLVLAAAVCGLFWGLLYLRYRSVFACALSHTLWDLAVFLLFPFDRV